MPKDHSGQCGVGNFRQARRSTSSSSVWSYIPGATRGGSRMCSHYEAPSSKQLALAFGFDVEVQEPLDLWPGYLGPFLRSTVSQAEAASREHRIELLRGSFGLIPSWSDDTKIARRTYNARSETVAEKPSYRNAWRKARKRPANSPSELQL
ncbi:SOS response-associated peptidase family protein [Pseudomonas sp. NyZ201]|uniref:SOS response-associated peptidase family protein n=1 Tax=Pseudomonas sp. NyZ201 TaxID=3409857 RepID=UPI003CE78972